MRKIILVTLKSTLLMKKIITLLVLMCSLSVVAQEYTPLVREGVKWECALKVIDYKDNDGRVELIYPYSIELIGDTLIENMNYKYRN